MKAPRTVRVIEVYKGLRLFRRKKDTRHLDLDTVDFEFVYDEDRGVDSGVNADTVEPPIVSHQSSGELKQMSFK